MQLSQLLAQRRKFDDALKVLDEGGAADAGIASGDRKLFNQRLNVLIQSKQRHLAEQALLDALAKGGDDLSLQMMLVRVNFEGGRYDEALDASTRSSRPTPTASRRTSSAARCCSAGPSPTSTPPSTTC